MTATRRLPCVRGSRRVGRGGFEPRKPPLAMETNHPTMTRNFTPEEAVERFIRERQQEMSEKTIRNNRSGLNQFTQFCKQEEIDSISDIDPFLVSDFRIQRQEEVSENTVYNNIVVVRTFIRWCESKDLLEDGIADNMVTPDRSNMAKEETISPEEVSEALSYLEKYEYATLRHALFALLWDTGIRIGAARSLNVDDFCKEGKYITLSHNPEEDTPLKNKRKSERDVNLHTWCADVISDYIEARRIDATDEYGNRPLFSSEHGRAHRTSLRKHITVLTRPCYYSNDCPHDRVIDDCEATNYNAACKCPSSVSPHPVRRSSITHWLNEGHSKELISDRMDVSKQVLEEHYDARSEEEKRELRREMLDIK